MPGVWLYERPVGVKFDVVVQPVASIENHGIMPVGTDYIIARCFTEKLMARLEGSEARIAVAPIIPYSTAVEHEGLGYTVSIEPRNYIGYLFDTLRWLSVFAQNIVVALFHGGAYSPSYTASRLVRRHRSGVRVVVYNFWDSVARTLAEYGVKNYPIHADPVEASVLLACGSRQGVVEASESEVVKGAKERAEQLRSLLLPPWLGDDAPQKLYPSEPVKANRRLGEVILENALEDLEALLMVLQQS